MSNESWTPLWSTIVTSTLWCESKDVRLLFVTMLALKNRDGIVIGATAGLARQANLTFEETVEAIKVLESPDAKSDTTQEFGGRRIKRVEGGWLILNHTKYRDLVQKIQRRNKQAAYQARYRERQREMEGNPKPSGPPLAGELGYMKELENEGQEAADKLVDSMSLPPPAEQETPGSPDGTL